MCPPPDETPYPTLGALVCAWIEENLCHGPGDLLGQPVKLSPEQVAWIYRMYEVESPYLETRKGGVVVRSANPRAAKRRFQRCALSLRKGSSKTEFAAWIAAAELHPDAPVRCAGFDGEVPIPCAVTDPYIPMIAYTEEQSEELAYGALRRILEEVAVGSAFDVGLERIIRLDGRGKAEAVAGSPNARDGARTTFQHADETHRFTLDNHKRGWRVMLANLAKRPLADPWALETTTAYEPGAGSVAESTMEYAEAVISGKAHNPRLFFFHREASESIAIDTRAGLRKAVVEASGPYIAAWSDIDRIVDAFGEPDADRQYLERVWLNRRVQSSGRAFDVKRWAEIAKPDVSIPEGAAITLGFDGSRYDDATALIAQHVTTGHLWPLGIWEKPLGIDDWEVPVEEVDAVVSDAFERYAVTRMYCDPPKWESWVATWAGRYGKERVVEWWTNRRKPMGYAIRAFVASVTAGEVAHGNNRGLNEHISNARKQNTGLVDEDERPLWVLRKERPDSPKKIDGAVAAVLANEARNDSVAAGEGMESEPFVLVFPY